MILQTTIYDFKTNLSRYIAELEAGKYKKIALHRRNKLVGYFTLPNPMQKEKMPLGVWRDEFHFDKALFDSADAEIDFDIYGDLDNTKKTKK